MAARGPKSAAAVLAAAPVTERPAPPEHLTEFQAAEWVAIVDRLPSDWFTRETHGLLIQFVRHLENAHKVAQALDGLTAVLSR